MAPSSSIQTRISLLICSTIRSVVIHGYGDHGRRLSDADPHAHADRDPSAYSYPDAHGDSNAHAYAYANGHGHGDTYAYADGHVHPDAHVHAQADCYAHRKHPG